MLMIRILLSDLLFKTTMSVNEVNVNVPLAYSKWNTIAGILS